MTEFIAVGSPAPQGSKRHVGGGRMVESSKRVAPWRRTVAAAARPHFPTPLDGPVCVEAWFILPRPKNEPKRTTRPHTRRPDVDKLARAILDALTGIAYTDDSQVTDLKVTKRTSLAGVEAPCARINITPGDPNAIPPMRLWHRTGGIWTPTPQESTTP